MKNTLPGAAFLLAVGIFIACSCQKEIHFPGDAPRFVSGWSFVHSNNKYEGCIKSADYEMVNGMKILSIKGSNGVNTFLSITIPAPGGKLIAGTVYTAAQGAQLIVDDKNGNTYHSNSNVSSFQFKVIDISDTSVVGSFTASLTDAASGNYVISNGNVSALIGKINSCGIAEGSIGTSGYSLISSGVNCSDVTVQGDYLAGIALTSTNKVAIKVNVSRVGSWSLATATSNGIRFSGTGSFTATGINTIELTGSGTPETAGTTGFPIAGASNSCTFYIQVN